MIQVTLQVVKHMLNFGAINRVCFKKEEHMLDYVVGICLFSLPKTDKNKHNQTYSDTFRHIQTYSDIFKHIQTYSNIFKHIYNSKNKHVGSCLNMSELFEKNARQKK